VLDDEAAADELRRRGRVRHARIEVGARLPAECSVRRRATLPKAVQGCVDATTHHLRDVQRQLDVAQPPRWYLRQRDVH